MVKWEKIFPERRENVLRRVEKNEINQTEAAELLGVSQSTISYKQKEPKNANLNGKPKGPLRLKQPDAVPSSSKTAEQR